MKNDRQAKILEIISAKDIETQAQLIEELDKLGVKSTQATLSRDIKQLRLIKEQTPDGIYRYSAGSRGSRFEHEERLRTIFRESVTSFDTAQNLVVIKTLPGLANAACSAIDSMEIAGLVGSIAGDDTIFLAMRDNTAAELFSQEIQSVL
jgi:transcriptional regulator of arginine metabolism